MRKLIRRKYIPGTRYLTQSSFLSPQPNGRLPCCINNHVESNFAQLKFHIVPCYFSTLRRLSRPISSNTKRKELTAKENLPRDSKMYVVEPAQFAGRVDEDIEITVGDVR